MIKVKGSEIQLEGMPIQILYEFSHVGASLVKMLVEKCKYDEDEAIALVSASFTIGITDLLDDEEDEDIESNDEEIDEAIDILAEAIKRAFK